MSDSDINYQCSLKLTRKIMTVMGELYLLNSEKIAQEITENADRLCNNIASKIVPIEDGLAEPELDKKYLSFACGLAAGYHFQNNNIEAAKTLLNRTDIYSDIAKSFQNKYIDCDKVRQ